MQEIDNKALKEWQYLMLKILLEFKRICDKNNIKYNLAGGTLIGAIRHKGFIPWDDDIDVVLMRDEYNRFIEVCKTDLSKEFFLQTPETEKNYPYGTKLMLLGTVYETSVRSKTLEHNGIYIDVLAYDNIPDNSFIRFFYCNWIHVLIRVYAKRLGYTPRPHKLYQRLALTLFTILLFPVSNKRLKNSLSTYHLKYKNKDTKEVCILDGAWGYKKEKHLRKTVTEFIETDFEGYKVLIPSDYDTLLREQYGDYMKLPPIEKQTVRHRCEKLEFGIYEKEAEENYMTIGRK